jgi:DNA replication licensing factor MCM2
LSSSLQDDSDNNPSTPISPASAGFSTDRLPPTRNTESYSDEEAAEDPHIVDDVVNDMAAGTPADAEDEEGEDLYNDNYLE